ncbi:MAG: hypothetical protein JWQ30_1125, partial [Sediminibacterium sp.]|nr:hypothetical protein [Sediminibacterium sp.]
MILYILKSILCLAILLLVYLLFLEKEKMHRFNRWYLLGSIVFACIVPLISFEMQRESLSLLRNNYFEILSSSAIVAPTQDAVHGTVVNNTNYLLPVLLSIYGLITSFLLARFFRNIYLLLSSAAKNKVVRYQGA